MLNLCSKSYCNYETWFCYKYLLFTIGFLWLTIEWKYENIGLPSNKADKVYRASIDLNADGLLLVKLYGNKMVKLPRFSFYRGAFMQQTQKNCFYKIDSCTSRSLKMLLPLRLVLILRIAVSTFSSNFCSTISRSWTTVRCDNKNIESTVTTRACWQNKHLDSFPNWSTKSRSLSRQFSISLNCRDIRSLLLSFLVGREIYKKSRV